MIALILSGGSGTRLWPISRQAYPKQFSPLFAESLQTQALKRAEKLNASQSQPTWIVANESLKDFTRKKAQEAGFSQLQLLFEPAAKNTAAALAFASHVAKSKGLQEEVFAVLPADQLILNEEAFLKTLRASEEHLKRQTAPQIVVLGIKPTYPATGYGYIQTESQPLSAAGSLSVYEVKKFHEKPSLEVAQDFLKDGHFHWNAGIFIFKPSHFLTLLKKYQPGLIEQFSQLQSDLSNLQDVYLNLQSISIDYALIEKLNRQELACIPTDMRWSDVGSWDSVAEVYQSLGESSQALFSVNSKENFVFPYGTKTYGLVGCEDLMVVDTADATLICKKGHSQDVKLLVDQLARKKPELVAKHIFEERPWGRFEILKEEEHYKSKVIQVQALSQISYQSHAHREEHWIVTKGFGEVVLDDKVIPVERGTYVKIPQGSKHRIRNTHQAVLEFIEVQLGSYFGEDDIVRYQDDYERVK